VTTTHLGLMVLFAAAVALVFAALLRDDWKAQAQLASRILVALVVGGWALGWVVYLITP
jgi:hypothetical protein